MPKEITELTEEQRAAMPGWVDKWVANGLSTEPADFDKAEKAAVACYNLIGKPAPTIRLHMGSPYAAIVGGCLSSVYYQQHQKPVPNLHEIVGRNIRREKFSLKKDYGVDVNITNLNDYIKTNWYNYRGANLWSSWIAYVTYFRDICNWENPALENFKLDETISTNCGLVWFSEECVALSDRPKSIVRDNGNRLHNDVGKALEYHDGWGVYSWHGYRIPEDKEWIIETKNLLNPNVIEKETNAELRRIMLEIYGFENYLKERGATLIAEDEIHGQKRRLLDITVNNEPIRVVEVVNGTVEPDGSRRKFVIGCVRNNNKWPETPHEAVAWSYGISPKTYKEIVRT